jgi:hypothetical protein
MRFAAVNVLAGLSAYCNSRGGNMIEISRLTEKDKGREVVYHVQGTINEFGIISSWNERFIFVKYNGNQQSHATKPENLRFSIEG